MSNSHEVNIWLSINLFISLFVFMMLTLTWKSDTLLNIISKIIFLIMTFSTMLLLIVSIQYNIFR